MELRRSRREHLLLVGAAVGLALLFTIAVLNYYRAFHFGVGPAFAALTLGLPLAFLLALAVAYASEWLARRRGAARPLRWTILWMVVALLSLFAIEWIRTSNDRARDRLADTVHSPNVALQLTIAADDCAGSAGAFIGRACS